MPPREGAHAQLWPRQADEGGRRRKAYAGHGARAMITPPGPTPPSAFAQAGRWMATGCYWKNAVRIWDTETLAPAATLVGHRELINDLEFNADGLLVSSDSSGALVFWDVEERREAGVWRKRGSASRCALTDGL